ncbi:MAG: DUF488 domain-containing protein [Nitrososphaerota archaeon]|nr:DUF488 domain-containing protein [Nitrososphaerales archaeon]MDW8045464.1 DUF488 domain-containing protein [Nitrososphaerota archaeon]
MTTDSKRLYVYTIGHGKRKREAFLELLKEHGIDILVDVRRWPRSRIGYFSKESLEKWLPEANVRYVWLGDELGGYRRGGYEEYMHSRAFLEGIAHILRLAEDGRVCLMCLEISPNYCHRRFISHHLNRLGVNIVHILSKGRYEVIRANPKEDRG